MLGFGRLCPVDRTANRYLYGYSIPQFYASALMRVSPEEN